MTRAMVEPPPLWHFTSLERAERIDRGGGWLLPGARLLEAAGLAPFTEGGRYVWLIAEPNPAPILVGFNDRTEYLAVRYAVVKPEVAQWWPAVRHRHSRAYLAALESHALPTLWWVADQPVRVTRDPTWTDPTRLRRGGLGLRPFPPSTTLPEV